MVHEETPLLVDAASPELAEFFRLSPPRHLCAPRNSGILPFFEGIRDGFRVPMLFASHDVSELVGICDRVLALDRDRKVALGPPSQLFEDSSAREFALRESHWRQ